MSHSFDKLREMEQAARDIGRVVKTSMPSDVGFVLVLFDCGEDGFTSYIASTEREATINALKELIVMMELEKAGPGCPSN